MGDGGREVGTGGRGGPGEAMEWWCFLGGECSVLLGDDASLSVYACMQDVVPVANVAAHYQEVNLYLMMRCWPAASCTSADVLVASAQHPTGCKKTAAVL